MDDNTFVKYLISVARNPRGYEYFFDCSDTPYEPMSQIQHEILEAVFTCSQIGYGTHAVQLSNMSDDAEKPCAAVLGAERVKREKSFLKNFRKPEFDETKEGFSRCIPVVSPIIGKGKDGRRDKADREKRILCDAVMQVKEKEGCSIKDACQIVTRDKDTKGSISDDTFRKYKKHLAEKEQKKPD